jgi:hypothetical protein
MPNNKKNRSPIFLFCFQRELKIKIKTKMSRGKVKIYKIWTHKMAQRRALRDRQQQMTRINDNGFRSQLTRPTKSSPNAFFYECPATRAKILKNQNQNLWAGKGGNEEN